MSRGLVAAENAGEEQIALRAMGTDGFRGSLARREMECGYASAVRVRRMG